MCIEGKDYSCLPYHTPLLERVLGKLGFQNILAGYLKDHNVLNPLLTAEHALLINLLSWKQQLERK